MPSAGSNNSSSAIETITDVDGGGKRGQNSGGLVTFHSAPFPLGRGCSLRTARSGQGRAGVARRSEPFTARTVLRSSTRGKGVALNGPLKWPSRSPPLTAWSAAQSQNVGPAVAMRVAGRREGSPTESRQGSARFAAWAKKELQISHRLAFSHREYRRGVKNQITSRTTRTDTQSFASSAHGAK